MKLQGPVGLLWGDANGVTLGIWGENLGAVRLQRGLLNGTSMYASPSNPLGEIDLHLLMGTAEYFGVVDDTLRHGN